MYTCRGGDRWRVADAPAVGESQKYVQRLGLFSSAILSVGRLLTLAISCDLLYAELPCFAVPICLIGLLPVLRDLSPCAHLPTSGLCMSFVLGLSETCAASHEQHPGGEGRPAALVSA